MVDVARLYQAATRYIFKRHWLENGSAVDSNDAAIAVQHQRDIRSPILVEITVGSGGDAGRSDWLFREAGAAAAAGVRGGCCNRKK